MNIKNLSIVLDEGMTTVGVQYGNGKAFAGDTYTFVARREMTDQWSEGVMLLVQNNDTSLHIAKLVRIDEDVCFDENDSRTYSYVVGIINTIEADQMRADVDERANHIRNYKRKAQRQALRDSYAAGTLEIGAAQPEAARFVAGGPAFEQNVGRSLRKGWVDLANHPQYRLALTRGMQIKYNVIGILGICEGKIIRVNHEPPGTDHLNVVESYTVETTSGTCTVMPKNILAFKE